MTKLSSAVAGSALILGGAAAIDTVSMVSVFQVGKTGFVLAVSAAPAVGAAAASLSNKTVARVLTRLVLIGPVAMTSTLGVLFLTGWPLFSADAVYWEPVAMGLAVLFVVNVFVLAPATANTQNQGAGARA